MKIGIVGIGLMGGSLALSLKKRGFCSDIYGVDLNNSHSEKAYELGLITKISTLDELYKTVDLIILAIPVDVTREILPGILDQLSDHQFVTDMGSTKSGICDTIEQHPNRNLFVASHPMAGTENSGPEAAIDNLFDDKVTIICDKQLSKQAAIETVESMYSCLNMRIIHMDSKTHDMHVSYVSHISHISSFVLGKTVLEIEKDESTIFNMAGSGFASTARLAKSSPEMWAPIFEQNAKYIVPALDTYIDNLKEFKNLIESKDRDQLISLMSKVNDIRRVLDGIKLNEDMDSQKD